MHRAIWSPGVMKDWLVKWSIGPVAFESVLGSEGQPIFRAPLFINSDAVWCYAFDVQVTTKGQHYILWALDRPLLTSDSSVPKECLFLNCLLDVSLEGLLVPCCLDWDGTLMRQGVRSLDNRWLLPSRQGSSPLYGLLLACSCDRPEACWTERITLNGQLRIIKRRFLTGLRYETRYGPSGPGFENLANL